MNYKIQSSYKKSTKENNNHDDISRNGNILTINGQEYDLSDPKQLAILDDSDPESIEYESCENQRVYKSGDDVFIRLHVSFEQDFLLMNNNYMLFHDKDLNGILDLSEICEVLDCMCKSEADRKKEHLDFKKTFSDEEWKARM